VRSILKEILISTFKTFSVFAILLTTVLVVTFSGNEAHAVNIPLLEGQRDCGTSSSSGSSDDKKDDDKDDDSDSENSSDGELGKDQKKLIKKAYDHFHGDYGFSGSFIAGILGNWWLETGGTLDPKASEGDTEFSESKAKAASDDPNRGIGYGQWTFERHTDLVDYAKSKDKDWWDSELQFEYMIKKDSSKDTLKSLAKNSSDDPVENTVDFHNDWEVSADSPEKVKNERGGATKKIWNYMKDNDMDGDKDTKKIDKVGGSGDDDEKGASASSTDNDEKVDDPCEEDEGGGNGTGVTDGEMGKKVKANGKKGKKIDQWEVDEVPEKYKKHIEIPEFDKKHLEGSPYAANGSDKGQCTELTWGYMKQLWSGEAQVGNNEVDGNGNVIWKKYKSAGAKITKDPTVGYGFSSDPPLAGAADPTVGHTGIVVGVLDDGKWLAANYNLPPHPAPERKVVITLIDGNDADADNHVTFFSGKGKPKLKDKSKDK